MNTNSVYRTRLLVYTTLAIAAAWTLTFGWSFAFDLGIAIFG